MGLVDSLYFVAFALCAFLFITSLVEIFIGLVFIQRSSWMKGFRNT